MKPIYYLAILATGLVAGTFAEETTGHEGHGHENHSDSGHILENLNPEISVIIDSFYFIA